jgi:CDP-glycerol glycerophosphotransferase (TagB/SpsB family)
MLKKLLDTFENDDLTKSFELALDYKTQLENSTSYWTIRGNLSYTVGEVNIALDCFKKACLLNKCNMLALENLINLLNMLGLKEEADSYLNLSNSIKGKINKLVSIDFLEKATEYALMDNFLFKHNSKQEGEVYNYINNFLFNSDKEIIYYSNEIFYSKNEIYSLLDFQSIDFDKYTVYVPLSSKYLEDIQALASFGIKKCFVMFLDTSDIENPDIRLTEVNKDIMRKVRDNTRENTVVMSYLNPGDSNVFAMKRFIPKALEKKYKIIFLQGYEAYEIDNKILIPLIASISISGHSTFLSYPIANLMQNIEVGHGAMPIKACGALDKEPNFAFLKHHYQNVDVLCVTSRTDMALWASFTGTNKDNFLISGSPRFELLKSRPRGRKNLEKTLNTKLGNKNVIINMPTFHIHEGSGRVNGNEKLNGFIKIENFNYEEFDKFLENNNSICVLKTHHAEESVNNQIKDLDRFKNIYTLTNQDLVKNNLDLYEVLVGADMLITDYSSVYTDFLYMDKPIIFLNSDLKEYRENRGIALEPYDYWTAGPKVQNQICLQEEINNYLNDKNYYKKDRDRLSPVFFKDKNSQPCKIIWDYIDESKHKRV